jgi:hypothetical protein
LSEGGLTEKVRVNGIFEIVCWHTLIVGSRSAEIVGKKVIAIGWCVYSAVRAGGAIVVTKYDAISGFNFCYFVAYGFNNTGAFVAKNDRKWGSETFLNCYIGMAYTATYQFNSYFVFAWGVKFNFLQYKISAYFSYYGC